MRRALFVISGLIFFFLSCKNKPMDYNASVADFDSGLAKLENALLSEKITRPMADKAIAINDALMYGKLENIYQLAIKENRNAEFNKIWLRTTTYRLIVLRDKCRKRASLLGEKEGEIYFACMAAVSNDVTSLWRNYFPDDRHVTEAVLSGTLVE
jgi:hypothetical protein